MKLLAIALGFLPILTVLADNPPTSMDAAPPEDTTLQAPDMISATNPESLGDPRWSVQYLIASDDSLRSVLSNRTDIRLQWNRGLSDAFMADVDTKAILRLNGDDHLDPDESMTVDARIRTLNLNWSGSSTSLKAGYQITVWGELDTASILDMVSPRDFSESAFTSPEDARLGQPGLNFTWYSSIGQWQWLYHVKPETNRYPEESKRQIVEIAGLPGFAIKEEKPRFGEDSEWGLRWKKTFGSSDVAVMAARILEDDPVLSIDVPTTTIYARFPDYDMFGASANFAAGRWLWQLEVGEKRGRKIFFNLPGQIDETAVAFGFEYNANGAYRLAVETGYRDLKPRQALPFWRREHSVLTARWSKSFVHETLQAVYYTSYQHPYKDKIHSASLQYKVNDSWLLEWQLTIIDSSNSDSPLHYTDAWDRTGLRARLSW